MSFLHFLILFQPTDSAEEPNFTNGVLIPQQNLSNPRLNFGADSAALDARAIQLAAKITF